MPKRLFICEKPSLGRAIADGLSEISGSQQSKSRTCIRVGDDTVTWALGGHMYELEQPDFYDPALKQWGNLSLLPFAPDRWRRRPQDGEGAQDKLAHLSAIRGMVKEAQVVVNVGDAEREGQLIIDEMLEEMGWDPFADRTKRVWVKSYAMRDVVAAINGMFPNADKRNLSLAATLRQRADWTHGLNLTRLYTTLARNTGADRLLSVGRVQTPTLKLVVDRDREIEAFRPVDHFLPNGLFRHANGTFKADWDIPDDHEGLDPENRLVDRKVAEAVAAKVAGKAGRIESCETKAKQTEPPLPYSMNALQTDASAKLGLTAAQTMEVAQSLYEKHKATTYPRTDSRHLPKSILQDEAPGIMAALAGTPSVADAARRADLKLRSGAWDDSKVSDHHAIIPTGEFSPSTYAAMSAVERGVFDLIAKAFVAQFHPAFRYKSLSAVVGIEGYRFKATGRVVVEQCWKTVYGASADDEEEPGKEADQSIPQMAKGDPVTAEATAIASKRTTPPAYFTDGTLVAAMAKIERFVLDPKVKAKLREVDGIGTEATRAPTIEGLLSKRKGYLKRDGKKIKSTDIGRTLVDSVPNEVADPGITAIWEAQLGKIEKGEASGDQFWQVLLQTLGKLVARGKESGGIRIKGASIEALPGSGGTCPKCGKGTMVTVRGRSGRLEGKLYIRCNNWRKDDPTSCDNVVWPEDDRPKVKPIEGDGKPCPKCGKGTLRTRQIMTGEHKGRTYLSCDNWRKDDPSSCSHREFPKDEVKPLKGHGDKCAKCSKGTMLTKQIHKGDNKGKRFLSCSAYPSCENSIFPEEGGFKRDGAGKGGGGKGAPPAKGAAARRASPAAGRGRKDS